MTRLFSLSPRGVIGLVLTLNAVAVIGAALTGNLPTWPPGATDIHVPEQTGVPLFRISGDEISISNSLFTMWIVMAVLVLVGLAVTRDLREVPGRFQSFIEFIVQGLIDFMSSAGGPGIVRYLPLFGTLFLFLLLSNWLSILPLVGQVELLHKPTADYHVNFGLALTAFVMYQAAGIRKLGPGYFTRWFNFTGFRDGVLVGVVMVFVGILELFSELFRMLTLTLRLWGNIWGGEIVLTVVTALLLIPSLPLPFIGLEIFIGFIQAFVFAFLVLLYIVLALESHGGEEHEGSHEAEHAAA